MREPRTMYGIPFPLGKEPVEMLSPPDPNKNLRNQLKQVGSIYTAMAKTLAAALDDATLVRLQELMDSDSMDQLFMAISAIVQKRHPELFAEPAGVDKPSG